MALISFSAGGPLLTLAMHGETPFVRCLLAFYLFMDIRQSEFQKTENAETLERFSPIIYLEAVSRNISLNFVNHPRGVHGFDNQNNDDRSREIIRAALEFMKAHLKPESKDT